MPTREKLGKFLRDIKGYADQTSIGIELDKTDASENVVGGGEPQRSGFKDDPYSGDLLLSIQDTDSGGPSLLNDFLAYLTEIENYYKLKGGATPAQPLSHIDDDGLPIVLKYAENTGAENVYQTTSVEPGDGLASTMLEYSDSKYMTNVEHVVSKLGDIGPQEEGSEDRNGARSGNTLLKSIQGRNLDKTGKTFRANTTLDNSHNAIEKVNVMLGVYNRFNIDSERAFFPEDSKTSDLSGNNDDQDPWRGTTTAQKSFGKNNYGDETFGGMVMRNEDLEKVARSMILKSLGLTDLNKATPRTSQDPDDYDWNAMDVYSTTGQVQNGASEIRATSRAVNSKGGPETQEGNSPRAGRGAFETDEAVESYGSEYGPDLSATGNETLSTIKLRTAAAIIAMKSLGGDLYDNLKELSNETFDLGRGPYKPGLAKVIAAKSKMELFARVVMPRTKYPIGDCIDMGEKVLFGTDSIDQPRTSSYQGVSESHLFWYAVARSAIKKFQSMSQMFKLESFTSQPSASVPATFDSIVDSGMIGIMRTLAQIGDIALYSTGGNIDLEDALDEDARPFRIDTLPDGPATRISKSRSQSGLTSAALAWRGNSVPAMYLLPRNVVKAAMDMNNFAMGGNPTKGHTTNSLFEKSYININAAGQSTRIPTDVVQRFENALDAEYVPFYFHDVRTNEIVTFHAFLETLSDSYSPQYSSEGGYGRIDKVQIYKETSRTVTFSFYIAATSKEDFDEMWFKINKLTTLAYPQWTKGTVMTDTQDNTFVQPFSQAIGATPLVRLRIGDVIKSNYSRFNLARMFGVGERDFAISDDTFGGALVKSGLLNLSAPWSNTLAEIQLDKIFGNMFGSPMAMGFLGSGDSGASLGDKLLRSLVSNLSLNGFVNPIGANLVLRQLKDPDNTPNPIPETGNAAKDFLDSLAGSASSILPSDGYAVGFDFPILKASSDIGYIIGSDDMNRVRTTSAYMVNVSNKEHVAIPDSGNNDPSFKGFRKEQRVKNKLQYTVKVVDLDAPGSIQGKEIKCWHSDLLPNPDVMFTLNIAPFLDIIGAVGGLVQMAINETAAKATGLPADALSATTKDAAEFMHPGNNVITRAFENSGGRGLAGVVKSLSYTWLDSSTTWEIDWNSRAPKFCKVGITFDVIHDLPPGIDSSGYNRAPIYNVGKTMHSIIGDVQADGGLGGKNSYGRARSASSQKLKKDD